MSMPPSEKPIFESSDSPLRRRVAACQDRLSFTDPLELELGAELAEVHRAYETTAR